MTVTSVVKDADARTMAITARFDAADRRRLADLERSAPAGALVGAADISRDGDGAQPDTGPHRGLHHDRPRRRPTPGLVARARGRPAHTLEFEDGFADADGNPSADAPTGVIRVALSELTGGGTQMEITTAWASVEAMEQMLAMGTEAGMTAAVGQIDELLSLPARA